MSAPTQQGPLQLVFQEEKLKRESDGAHTRKARPRIKILRFGSRRQMKCPISNLSLSRN